MRLTAYTRRLEECRKRWNRRTVQFVKEAALILRAARTTAQSERALGTVDPGGNPHESKHGLSVSPCREVPQDEC
jgi:hypothetical protein